MKRMLALLICALAALGALAGCTGKQGTETGKAEDEILTYRRLEPGKTTLVVSKTGNLFIDPFLQEFEAQNPDVQVVCLDLTGGVDAVKPVVDWVRSGLAPDVMITPTQTFADEETVRYFENLSVSPVIQRYESESLNRLAIASDIYWLPGPSLIDCMIYNQTLFERYGWEVPATFDQFVALCAKITEDTKGEVEPWNPNAKYSGEWVKATQGFTYQELFGGVENRTWYNALLTGDASFTGHMEPYYRMVQTLIDNGILREEHFTYSATTRGKEFEAGKIAMINCPARDFASEEFTFAFMPFPTTMGDMGYICGNISVGVGVPKKERTPAVRDATDRFIDFFSSVKGQQAFVGEQMMTSNVKDLLAKPAGKLAALQPALDAGHLFTVLGLDACQGAVHISLCGDAHQMLLGEKTAPECVAAVDAMLEAAKRAPAQKEQKPPEVVASASEPFTILQTSCFLADLYREAAGADIGLINHNVAYRGNLMRIFKGDLTPAHVEVLKPRSFGNDAALLKAEMTGRQLLDALNHPVGDAGESDSVYAFSGLKCEIAPWNPPGEKYLAVALADGTPLDTQKLYTVAFWQGTVDEAYLTGSQERCEGSFEELLTAKLQKDGAIAPAKDGRIKLVWK